MIAPDELELILLDPEAEVTSRTLAGLWSCTERTVTDLAKRGVAIRSGRGRYRLLASSINYAEHQREVAAGRGGNGDIDLAVERALLAREQREGHALKNAIARGEVVKVEEVGRQVEREYAVVRSRLLSIPGKLGAELTVEQCARLEVEVRDALSELHDAESIAGRLDLPDREAEEGEDDPEAAAAA